MSMLTGWRQATKSLIAIGSAVRNGYSKGFDYKEKQSA